MYKAGIDVFTIFQPKVSIALGKYYFNFVQKAVKRYQNVSEGSKHVRLLFGLSVALTWYSIVKQYILFRLQYTKKGWAWIIKEELMAWINAV